MDLSLRPITRENFLAILHLHVAAGQEHFVATNERSIAQAYVEPTFVPLAIYDGDIPIGFVMHGHDEQTGIDWIIRFMIAAEHQRKGYGRAALRMIIEHLAARSGCTEIRLSYEPENVGAAALYAGQGFEETGEIEEGEVVARLQVQPETA
jgi:diamine N-acetyltransferase